MTDRPEDELFGWARESDEFINRIVDEHRELDRRRNELLIRAREAGMTDTEIAQALNAGHREPFVELTGDWVSTQDVAEMMSEAERELARAVKQFTREALDES